MRQGLVYPFAQSELASPPGLPYLLPSLLSALPRRDVEFCSMRPVHGPCSIMRASPIGAAAGGKGWGNCPAPCRGVPFSRSPRLSSSVYTCGGLVHATCERRRSHLRWMGIVASDELLSRYRWCPPEIQSRSWSSVADCGALQRLGRPCRRSSYCGLSIERLRGRGSSSCRGAGHHRVSATRSGSGALGHRCGERNTIR